MRRIQIIDLDNCISDDSHRRHLIRVLPNMRRGDPGWWTCFEAYHEFCWRDSARNLHELDPDAEKIIITGRCITTEEVTRDWLAEVAGIHPLYMLMRNRYDARSSLELKRMMVAWLWDANLMYGIKREEIVSAIDDRPDIVKMYRDDYGLNARRVYITEDHEHA